MKETPTVRTRTPDRCLLPIALLFWTAAAVFAQEETKPQPRECLLVMELRDGSRVAGTAVFEFLPVRSSYADMKIPVEQIGSVKFQDDNETVTVTLANGDRVQGVVNLPPFEIRTVFGKISVATAQISELAALPAGVPKGLLLWNQLDGSPSVVGPQVEFISTDGFVSGRIGKGVQVSGNESNGFSVPIGKLRNAACGAVEFWMQAVQKPSTVSSAFYDIVFGLPVNQSPVTLSYCANDRYGHGKYSLQSAGYAVYTESAAGSKSTDLLGDRGVWNHYAIVWDKAGIKAADGAKLALFINGKIHGAYSGTSSCEGPFLQNVIPEALAFHRNRNGFGGVMVYDELKIWDRAMTNFELSHRMVNPAQNTGGSASPALKPRMVVGLTDSSRVFGRIAMDAITFVSKSFGKVEVPVEQILKVVSDRERKTTKVTLQSRDEMVGSIEQKALPLKAAFADISIPLEGIVSIDYAPEDEPKLTPKAGKSQP